MLVDLKFAQEFTSMLVKETYFRIHADILTLTQLIKIGVKDISSSNDQVILLQQVGFGVGANNQHLVLIQLQTALTKLMMLVKLIKMANANWCSLYIQLV
jgi:hypothetical protein